MLFLLPFIFIFWLHVRRCFLSMKTEVQLTFKNIVLMTFVDGVHPIIATEISNNEAGMSYCYFFSV
jgi:hypothetical protein